MILKSTWLYRDRISGSATCVSSQDLSKMSVFGRWDFVHFRTARDWRLTPLFHTSFSPLDSLSLPICLSEKCQNMLERDLLCNASTSVLPHSRVRMRCREYFPTHICHVLNRFPFPAASEITINCAYSKIRARLLAWGHHEGEDWNKQDDWHPPSLRWRQSTWKICAPFDGFLFAPRVLLIFIFRRSEGKSSRRAKQTSTALHPRTHTSLALS